MGYVRGTVLAVSIEVVLFWLPWWLWNGRPVVCFRLTSTTTISLKLCLCPECVQRIFYHLNGKVRVRFKAGFQQVADLVSNFFLLMTCQETRLQTGSLILFVGDRVCDLVRVKI